MKKDKEWLKEEVNAQNIILDKGYIYTEDILKLIDQLEEPEQEKVVIPQFVADWIETMKQQNFTLGEVAEHLYSGDIKWSLLREYERWARLNFTKFARAWLDGYTVEKEKLYRVILPDAESDASSNFLGLVRTGDNRIVISKIKVSTILHSDNVRFTEQEIKRNHEYLWQFAEEVPD